MKNLLFQGIARKLIRLAPPFTLTTADARLII